MNQLYLIAYTAFFSLTSCSDSLSESDMPLDDTVVNETHLVDTVFNIDSTEFDVGKLVEGKRVGVWYHYFINDTSRWEERFFIENEKIVRCKYFQYDHQYLEENNLSNGMYQISYHSNGCLNTMGWIRIVDGQEGEADGLWIEYDSLGNLHSETIYDYAHNKIIYKEYEPSQHYLIKECEYYQETGEATLLKNGTWKYYRGGQLDHVEVHNMEPTLEDFGK